MIGLIKRMAGRRLVRSIGNELHIQVIHNARMPIESPAAFHINGKYNPHTNHIEQINKCIQTSRHIYNMPPSAILYTMLHEYCHSVQYSWRNLHETLGVCEQRIPLTNANEFFNTTLNDEEKWQLLSICSNHMVLYGLLQNDLRLPQITGWERDESEQCAVFYTLAIMYKSEMTQKYPALMAHFVREVNNNHYGPTTQNLFNRIDELPTIQHFVERAPPILDPMYKIPNTKSTSLLKSIRSLIKMEFD